MGSIRQPSGSALSVAVEPSLPTTPELTDAEDSAELSGESVETAQMEEALAEDGDEFPSSAAADGVSQQEAGPGTAAANGDDDADACGR